MGLLNKKTVLTASKTGSAAILTALTPPYQLNDFLMLMLNQLSEWIPGESYYAYVADTDQTGLTLKATRQASGIASVGPNYAGLVLGGGIRTVPLEIMPPADSWAFGVDSDGMLVMGFGPKAVFRIVVDRKVRLGDATRERIQGWLHELMPVFDLMLQSAMTSEESHGGDGQPAPRHSRQDLVFKIPQLMGLLSELGTGVIKSSDGYLALWREPSKVEYPWVVGLGRDLANRIPPEMLYEASRAYRVAVWNESQIPQKLEPLGFQSLVAIPVDGVSGCASVLCMASADVVSSTPSLIGTLRYLADSLQSSLDSDQSSNTMAANYLKALLTASALLDEADPYNQSHHERVAQLCARLALRAGWPEPRVRAVEMAGRLHDVGMVTVALDVTHEKGNLAEKARQVIQQHSQVGYELLAGLPESVLPGSVAQAIREHHERYDGLGYPDGLKGNALSMEGRILACAEQFVARISARSYRQGLSVERALYELQKVAGSQLDAEVVSLLLKVYEEAGVRPETPV